MQNSDLVNVVVPAYEGNFTYGRSGYGINAITIHHMAGVLSAEQCGYIFQQVGRYGSSHYGIGNDGRIGQYVGEENTAWTNSNWESNCQSVTIETSNCATGGDWPVSDAALNSLIRLVADIAKRNNLGHLIPGQNLTWHSMFAATECPGPYLLARIDYIAQEANKINEEQPQPVPPTPIQYKIGDYVKINGIYISSDSEEMLPPAITEGVITNILEGARNPYLLNNGDLGWANNNCILGIITTTDNDDEELLDLVRKTIRGDFGNGEERKEALGDMYDKVQYNVERNLADGNTNWDDIRLY